MARLIIAGNSQQQLAVSATPAATPALSAGLYDIWATVDTYIKVGDTVSDVSAANGYLVRYGQTLPAVEVKDGQKIGGVSASAGTLSYHKVS